MDHPDPSPNSARGCARPTYAQLAFRQQPFSLNIGAFVANIKPIEGFMFANKSAGYQLTPFVRKTQIANIGKFHSDITVDLAGLTDLA